jgi:hypothetical protein
MVLRRYGFWLAILALMLATLACNVTRLGEKCFGAWLRAVCHEDGVVHRSPLVGLCGRDVQLEGGHADNCESIHSPRRDRGRYNR